MVLSFWNAIWEQLRDDKQRANAEKILADERVRASFNRNIFWNCNGVIAVSDLKWW